LEDSKHAYYLVSDVEIVLTDKLGRFAPLSSLRALKLS